MASSAIVQNVLKIDKNVEMKLDGHFVIKWKAKMPKQVLKCKIL